MRSHISIGASSHGWMYRPNYRQLLGDSPTRVKVTINGTQETQPDSVYAWFKPCKVIVSALIGARVVVTDDHRPIRISFKLNAVTPIDRSTNMKAVTHSKKVRSDSEIKEWLGNLVDGWLCKYIWYFESATKDRSQYERTQNDFTIDGDIVDSAAEDILKCIELVKDWAWEDVISTVDKRIDNNADHLMVRLGQKTAQIEDTARRLIDTPEDRELLSIFSTLEKEKLAIVESKVDQLIAKDMEKQGNTSDYETRKRNNKWFWEICKNTLGRDSFSKFGMPLLTDEVKRQKLEANDKTFIHPDPDFVYDLTTYKDVLPDRYFDLDDWKLRLRPLEKRMVDCVDDSSKLVKFIRGKKTIDDFYNHNANILSLPIYFLLKMMQMADYFPKVCRSSKLSFLTDRSIFNLESLAKILEGVVTVEFDKCLLKHYKLRGDPCQMAYQASRGTVLANMLGIDEIEQALHRTNKPVVMIFCDLVKAFNSADRAVMCEQTHQITGGGGLMSTRFIDRVYTFEGEVRGKEFNRGADPGAQMAVFGFKVYINNDVAFTTLNKELLHCVLFSDDRSPIASHDQVVSGGMQKQINISETYHDKYSSKYHSDNKKKAPHMLIFKKKGWKAEIPQEFFDLNFSGVPVEHRDTVTTLGLTISTDTETKYMINSNAKTSGSMISNSTCNTNLLSEYGHFTIPPVQKLQIITRNIRTVVCENNFTPMRAVEMIQSAFRGNANYSISTLWFRSRDRDLNEMRFWYVSATAAVLRLTANEVVGPAC